MKSITLLRTIAQSKSNTDMKLPLRHPESQEHHNQASIQTIRLLMQGYRQICSALRSSGKARTTREPCHAQTFHVELITCRLEKFWTLQTLKIHYRCLSQLQVDLPCWHSKIWILEVCSREAFLLNTLPGWFGLNSLCPAAIRTKYNIFAKRKSVLIKTVRRSVD